MKDNNIYKNILIYNTGGGLGDAIQLFPLILSLKNHFDRSNFYYLGAHENHFNNKLKDYKIEIENFDLNLKYFGFRWWHLLKINKEVSKKKINRFDLIIDLQSKIRNTIILKKIPTNNFFSSTFNFFFCTKKNNYFTHDGNISLLTLSNLEVFLDTKIKRINFNDSTLDLKYIEEAKKLLPGKNYIGFSITQGNVYRQKSWPLENFISLAKKYALNGKTPVFFIEKSNIKLLNIVKSSLPTALFPELQSVITSPALVTALASRMEKTITIDNGIMHMVSLAGTPMTILFGPTNAKKFSPIRNDVKILDSKELYQSKDISKISVDDVFNCS